MTRKLQEKVESTVLPESVRGEFSNSSVNMATGTEGFAGPPRGHVFGTEPLIKRFGWCLLHFGGTAYSSGFGPRLSKEDVLWRSFLEEMPEMPFLQIRFKAQIRAQLE
jgi:hypothetical protein